MCLHSVVCFSVFLCSWGAFGCTVCVRNCPLQCFMCDMLCSYVFSCVFVSVWFAFAHCYAFLHIFNVLSGSIVSETEMNLGYDVSITECDGIGCLLIEFAVSSVVSIPDSK